MRENENEGKRMRFCRSLEKNFCVRAAICYRGLYKGGSGRNLRPVWLKGERIPPSRGEEFPEIYGSY